MKRLGFLMVAGSFLYGAYLASLSPTTIVWAKFIPAMLLGAIGVVITKVAAKRHATSEEILAANRADIEESLNRLVVDLERLEAQKDSIETHALREEIDRRLREDLARFVDARESLAHIYGLQSYADVMSVFAAGERYVNRVWSASADGYGDEARKYITRAYEQFIDAKRRLDDLHNRHTAISG